MNDFAMLKQVQHDVKDYKNLPRGSSDYYGCGTVEDLHFISPSNYHILCGEQSQ